MRLPYKGAKNTELLCVKRDDVLTPSQTRPILKRMNFLKITTLALLFSLTNLGFGSRAWALKVGDKAPLFTANTHEGRVFDLKDRKGTWTVLYFYPKAETPGCTTQACAFRDAIKVIRDLKADVFGVSADDVDELKKFHENHRLNFDLLADPNNEVIKSYGTKMMLINISQRRTFIVDPDLVIRDINTKVDPAMDSQQVAARIKELQAKHQAK